MLGLRWRRREAVLPLLVAGSLLLVGAGAGTALALRRRRMTGND